MIFNLEGDTIEGAQTGAPYSKIEFLQQSEHGARGHEGQDPKVNGDLGRHRDSEPEAIIQLWPPISSF